MVDQRRPCKDGQYSLGGLDVLLNTKNERRCRRCQLRRKVWTKPKALNAFRLPWDRTACRFVSIGDFPGSFGNLNKKPTVIARSPFVNRIQCPDRNFFVKTT